MTIRKKTADDAIVVAVGPTPIFVASMEPRNALSEERSFVCRPPSPPSLFIRVTNHPRYRKIAASLSVVMLK